MVVSLSIKKYALITGVVIAIIIVIIVILQSYNLNSQSSTNSIAGQINLYNPSNVAFIVALVISYLLGIVHGITPDEHTWPITFSYAVGSGSTKGGMKAGLIFSSGFTLQRAVLSEVAYFALAGIFMTAFAFGLTYVFVGIAMLVAGIYIKRENIYPHWHTIEDKLGVLFHVHKEGSKDQRMEYEHKKNPIDSSDMSAELKQVPSKLAFVHGLIAGFGFGAFALIIYTVLSPSMPSPWLGWLPGFLFGIGTMTMQVTFGAFFGRWLTKVKKLTKHGITFVSRSISSDVLLYGGIAFAIGGAAILAFPQLLEYAIVTPIQVHNLHNLGIGFFMVIIVVVLIGILSYRAAMKKAVRLYSHKRAVRRS
jgi:ABC-type nickel/cobalt efflux system permease component RcnA